MRKFIHTMIPLYINKRNLRVVARNLFLVELKKFHYYKILNLSSAAVYYQSNYSIDFKLMEEKKLNYFEQKFSHLNCKFFFVFIDKGETYISDTHRMQIKYLNKNVFFFLSLRIILYDSSYN